MYIPEPFKVANTTHIDSEDVRSFIEENAFGQLISQVEGRPFSSHLPFLLSDDTQHLVCHVAKQNPQWESIQGQEVLITLQGSHAYISPSWYERPGVPTWNYQAVHIYGVCQVFHDVDKLRHLVDALTQKFESEQANPWKPSYSQSMLQAIVGIEVSISEVQCKFKLNQNRSETDRAQVRQKLRDQGATSLAEAMRKIDA